MSSHTATAADSPILFAITCYNPMSLDGDPQAYKWNQVPGHRQLIIRA